MKHHYVSSTDGSMYSTFIVYNGALGRGCDYLIIDDPHRLGENMETTINDVRQALCTRLSTPATGRILLVMQRLAPDDLSGVLLEGSTNCRTSRCSADAGREARR